MLLCVAIFLLVPILPHTYFLCFQKSMEIQGKTVKFLSDVKFKPIQDALDALMKDRARLGMGVAPRQAQVITFEMENILWERGLLDDDNPHVLLNTLVYVFGLYFALRGRGEHRRIRHYPSQLSMRKSADGRRYLEYREDVSKTYCGGLHSVKRAPKVTQAFELTETPERCPVRLYLFYNSVCPTDRPHDAFYLRPLVKFTKEKWFCNVPVGVNTLSSVVSRMCKEAGFAGFFSNHSLRATAATRLFDQNTDEQLIMMKTGHTSSAVRSYKRVSDDKLSALSDSVGCVPCKPKVAKCTVSSAGSDVADCDDSRGVHVTVNINVR